MSAENSQAQNIPYAYRQDAGMRLRQAIGDGLRGEHFFNIVIRPNLLPEDSPGNLPENVYWIGEKGARSIDESRDALGHLLIRLVDLQEMPITSAVTCAEALGISCFYDTEVYGFPTVPAKRKLNLNHELPLDQASSVTTLPKRKVLDTFGEAVQPIPFPISAKSADEYATSSTIATPIVLYPEVEAQMASILPFRG